VGVWRYSGGSRGTNKSQAGILETAALTRRPPHLLQVCFTTDEHWRQNLRGDAQPAYQPIIFLNSVMCAV
jgi:hypothetical protein